jgi:hypothetical protein
MRGIAEPGGQARWRALAGGAPVQEERRSAWFVKGAGEAFRSALAAISQPWQRAGWCCAACAPQPDKTARVERFRRCPGGDGKSVFVCWQNCCVMRCAMVDTAQVAVLIWRHHATPSVQCPEGKASQDHPAAMDSNRGANRF